MICNEKCLAYDENITENQKEDHVFFCFYCRTKKKLMRFKETCLYYHDADLINKLNGKDLLIINQELYNIINLYCSFEIDKIGYNGDIYDSVIKISNLITDKYKVEK